MAKKGGGGPSNQVGEAFITVGIDNTPLDAGLKAAEAKTQQSAQKMDAALGVVGKGGVFDRVGNGIKGATAGIRNAVGALTAVVGVASRLLGIVGLVTTGVYLASQAISALRTGFNSSADSAERLKKRIEEAAEVTKRLQEAAQEAADVLGIPGINPEALDPNFEDRGGPGRADDRIGLNVVLKDLGNATREFSKLEKRLDDLLRASAAGAGDFGMAIQSVKEQMGELGVLIHELERRRSDLESARSRGQVLVFQAAIAKIEKVLRDNVNKQLESIAISAARGQQLAEEQQASQHRGP